MNYLHDEDFLMKLDHSANQEKYVKIVSLDLAENPIEELTGIANGGSVSIDGGSKQQRTCSSLNFYLLDNSAVVTDAHWALKHKFRLEIGVKNTVDPKYDDIIWFKQGTFLITSFSCSRQATGTTINISGKDKMSLLDGTISGRLLAETKFDTMEQQEKDGTWTITKIPIINIIQSALKDLCHEDIKNIIIKDLDIEGYELWEYIGSDPMFFLIGTETQDIENITINGDMEVWENGQKKKLKELTQYYELNPIFANYNETASKITFEGDMGTYWVLRL